MGQTSNTKNRLIKAAAELMSIRGYNAVGVKEICEWAGVNKGSFYYFFPSKRDLALAVLDAQWEATRGELLDPAFARDLPPLERFQRLFQMVVASQRDTGEQVRGCFFGNLALELSAQDEIIRHKLQSIFQGWCEYFERVLVEAVTAGDLPEIDPAAAAQALLAYFEGMALLAKVNNDFGSVEQLAQRAIHAVIVAASPPVQTNG